MKPICSIVKKVTVWRTSDGMSYTGCGQRGSASYNYVDGMLQDVDWRRAVIRDDGFIESWDKNVLQFIFNRDTGEIEIFDKDIEQRYHALDLPTMEDRVEYLYMEKINKKIQAGQELDFPWSTN